MIVTGIGLQGNHDLIVVVEALGRLHIKLLRNLDHNLCALFCQRFSPEL
jgi:hypothetical protein